jgi:hypothetical protein
MKRQDINVVIVSAIIAAIISYVISSVFVGGKKSYQLTVPRVDAISSDFTVPDSRYFNSMSIDITIDIKIGDQNNTNPL